MKHRYVIALAFIAASLLASLTSCTPKLAPAADPPPPERLTGMRRWLRLDPISFYRIGYFTAAEVNSDRWEAVRRKQAQATQPCLFGAPVIVQRDVRWYPASKESREACAAVVYTMVCGGTSGLIPDNAEPIRQQWIASEPGVPFKAGCGEKDDMVVAARLKAEEDARKRKGAPRKEPIFGARLSAGARDSCKLRGGYIATLDATGPQVCMQPASDAGKTCTDESQCTGGGCFVDETANEFKPPRVGQRVTGKCARTDYADACGWRISKGRVVRSSCATSTFPADQR